MAPLDFAAMDPRRTALVTAAVALALVAGLVAAWRLRQPADPPAGAAAGADSALTERMIAAAPIDSTEIKTGWRDDVPGIDLAAFDPARREILLRHANSRMCTCGCGFTLAACRTYDPTCPVSLPRVEALRDSVAQGQITHADGLRKRLTVRANGD